MDSWNLIKLAYKQAWNIDPIIIDYLAVYDILVLCVQGRSISRICHELNYDPGYVQDVLQEFFLFSGFSFDLDFNSRQLYIRNRYNKYIYLLRARELDNQSTDESLKESYRINIIFDKIEREVEKYGARA